MYISRLTDAGRDGQVTLLISSSALVTSQTGDSILARTLTGRLIASLIQRTHRVTIASYIIIHTATHQHQQQPAASHFETLQESLEAHITGQDEGAG